MIANAVATHEVADAADEAEVVMLFEGGDEGCVGLDSGVEVYGMGGEFNLMALIVPSLVVGSAASCLISDLGIDGVDSISVIEEACEDKTDGPRFDLAMLLHIEGAIKIVTTLIK